MAAVRHCSIADITLSWCRLRCPAWVARYGGPTARKISATSIEARTGSAGRGLSRLEDAEPVERAGHGTHRAGRDLGVERGVLELGVAEQRLDDADIDTVLEQVRREAMAERVRADPLGDLRRLRRLDHDAVELPGADRLQRMLAREQPAVPMHDALLASNLPH